MKIKSKIAGISTTLLVAFAILLVSVSKSASITYTYPPVVLSDKVETETTYKPVDYLLAYPGKINPDNLLWYPKVIRDKAWYLVTFDIDKKLKLVDIKTEEVQIKYKAEKIKLPTEMGRRGLTGSSLAQTKSKELEQEEQRELNKLNIEKEHLLKLKSYRFPWN